MSENDFRLNTEKREKKQLFTKKKVVMGVSIFLTGVLSWGEFIFLTSGNTKRIWELQGTALHAWNMLIFASVFCCFISLISIAASKWPFTKILIFCIEGIGYMWLCASVAIPRLGGYSSSGFEFSRGNFVFVDLMILLPGILLIILGNLLREGFKMQEEVDEIL